MFVLNLVNAYLNCSVKSIVRSNLILKRIPTSFPVSVTSQLHSGLIAALTLCGLFDNYRDLLAFTLSPSSADSCINEFLLLFSPSLMFAKDVWSCIVCYGARCQS